MRRSVEDVTEKGEERDGKGKVTELTKVMEK